jgi:hypothetical protein
MPGIEFRALRYFLRYAKIDRAEAYLQTIAQGCIALAPRRYDALAECALAEA